jgi:hypothetical protein
MQVMCSAENQVGESQHSWLDFSLFAFVDSELEGLYKSYLARRSNSWAVLGIATVAALWAALLHKVVTGVNGDDPIPAIWWAISLLQLLTLGAALLVVVYTPSCHINYRRAAHAGCLIFIMITYQFGWILLFWSRFMTVTAEEKAALQHLQMFVVENLFTSAIWLMVLALSSGQLSDLMLTTLVLFFAMANNHCACASLGWSHITISWSSSFLAVSRVASVLVSDIAGPLIGGHASAPIMSCPVVLGIWQLIGWWIACLTVFVADISRRRAFLRTEEARAHLGPADAAAALKWPFGSATKSRRCVMVVLVLCYASSLIWNTALLFLA